MTISYTLPLIQEKLRQILILVSVSVATLSPHIGIADKIVITYTYNENSQLVGVLSNQGHSAQYTYDAAGNLLSLSSTFPHPSPGDIDRNGTIDLRDAILNLQVLGGNDVKLLDREADLNNDDKIGLAEAINTLQHISQ